MTNRVLNTDAGRWKSVMANFVAAKEAVDAIAHMADCDATDRIHDILDDTIQSIFSTAAPRLGAIADKLEILWDEDLFAEDDFVASYKQTIIGDVRRIERQMAGIAEPDASGGMDLDQVATDWANALAEYSQHVHFIEAGPSDRWKFSKKSDLLALKDEAVGKLLSLHAPDLAAVIRKIELLWSDDRLDPVFDRGSHHSRCCILRDLHRFECQIAS